MGKSWRHPVLVASVAAAVLAPAVAAHAAPNNNTSAKLRAAVSAEGIMEHAAALESFAGIEDHGNRLSGTPGYDASAAYVAERAAAAGLEVMLQDFEYDYFFGDIKAPVLSRGGTSFNPGIIGGSVEPFADFGTMFDSATGDVTAPLWAVDLKLPSTGGSTSGCEAADFTGMPAGAIALIQRGTCNFAVKLQNADTAGAGGVVLFNEGNAPDRMVSLFLLATPFDNGPAVGASFAVGQALAGGTTSGSLGTARLRAGWYAGPPLATANVIAETPEGDPGNVIAVGAHLDSVGVGPGINDNGSGSAGILEIAEQLEKTKPRNKIRFLWFGAEESGLIGSQHYVDELSAEERGRIAAMLNFDMIGSPNFARFVYDGDLSDSEDPGEEVFDPAGRPGSAAIEDIFLDYFASEGLATEPTAFDGRSDYGPFIDVGVPAGGLFTGAEVEKQPYQVALYGGAAGEAFDGCYHMGCDTVDNVNLVALEQMADAAAHTTLTLAMNTQPVNGERGKGNFKPRDGEPLPAVAGR